MAQGGNTAEWASADAVVEPERRALSAVTELAGCFISFEGGEGSGKSTQVRLLSGRLEALGYEVVATREPGGTTLGEIARAFTRKPSIFRRFHRLLTAVDWDATDPLAELFLMSAARAQLVSQVILPALGRNAIVLCDRYDDSTLAYQGYGRGLNLQTLRTVNAIATRDLHPALTVLIDVPPELGLERKRGEVGRDVIGSAGLEFHQRVREGYRRLAAKEPNRWLSLEGTQAAAALSAEIWRRVRPLLPATG